MLGQLGSFRRRCQRVTQGFSLRGIATQKQGRHHRSAPPDPPEKIEWWAVDGELFKAEKFDPKRVLSPLENEHISNKRRRRELIKHLGQSRLKLRVHNQDSYWAAYMRRFQVLRDAWEKHVWDPIPEPRPKRRNPVWVAEETDKYVWQDPRREAYTSGVANRNDAQDPRGSAYTFDLSRMDQSSIKSRFDEKIGFTGQGMRHSPYESRRNPGASSVRPGMNPLRQHNADIPRRNLRQSEFENFDDVFKDGDRNRSDANAKASLPTEDEGDSQVEIFNWDESDSEEGSGYEATAGGKDDDDNADEDDDDSIDDESEMKDIQQRKIGWYGNEDDLFKDDE